MDRATYRTLLLLAAVVLFVWAFGLILGPFLVGIMWALCLVSITTRPYGLLIRKWKRPRLAAATMVLGTALAFLVPLFVVGFLVARQVSDLSQQGFGDVADRFQQTIPGVYAWLDGFLSGFGTSVAELSKKAAPAVSSIVPGVAVGILGAASAVAFDLLVMLATQYFVYRDAPALVRLTKDLIPLAEEDTDRILQTLHSTTIGALVGGLLVALLQGALLAIGFAIVGIRAPAVWGLLAAIMSFVPLVGTTIVWAPPVAYLFLTGSMGSAWFLLLWCAVLVGSSDNLIRPWLLKKTGVTGVHSLILFFAVLSGIGLFGMSGVVFGPLLVALLTTALQIYREHVVPALKRDVAAKP